MNCVYCKMPKISPNIVPYGGFLCSSGHMQCNDCNSRHQGHCSVCGNSADFIHMIVNSQVPSLAAAQAKMALSAVGQAPSAPMLSTSNVTAGEKPSNCFHSQSMFEEIENQSNISQEHLSMSDSKDGDDGGETINNTLSSPVVDSHSNDFEAFSTKMGEKTSHPGISENKISSFMTPNVGKQHATSAQNGEVIKTNMPRNDSRDHVASVVQNDAFVFQEDPDDHNVIHTSEISFMDSTESMNNFLGRTSNPTSRATNLKEEINRMASKRIELLEEHVSSSHLPNQIGNVSPSNEVVEHYLQIYGPLATYHFPTYNCQQPHCDFNGTIAPPSVPMNSISVSTESEPSLRSMQLETATSPGIGLHNKFGNRNYVVMHATEVATQPTQNLISLDKSGRQSLDMRIERVLKTLQEDPKIPKVVEKLDLKNDKFDHLSKFEENHGQHSNKISDQHRNTHSSPGEKDLFLARLVNTHRAVFHPTDHLEPLVHSFKNLSTSPPSFKEPPPPQFEIIACSPAALQDLIMAKAHLLNTKPAVTQHMPPLPLRCPESKCSCMIFISDFHKHFEMDHSQLPMERITPFQCKNLLLDSRLDQCGVSKCHYLYLLRDKITGLGTSQYKDYLPLLVMTSRISLAELCGSKFNGPPLEFLVIWITGIVPEEFPISVSLIVWPRSGALPSCHLVYSGNMYSIRESQRAMDVVHSGQMLLLSHSEIERLTKGGNEMLNVQLLVH